MTLRDLFLFNLSTQDAFSTVPVFETLTCNGTTFAVKSFNELQVFLYKTL